MGQNASSRREAVRHEAAAWVIRLADPDCGPADRAAFAAWRDASLDHEVAYEREAATWEVMDRLRALHPGNTPPDPDLLKSSRAPASFGRLPWAAIAAAAMVAVGTSGAVILSAMASPAYATGVGERRTVVLSDGTRIELNTDSKVIVRYRDGVRQVELARGEAVFEVSPDTRPFVVLAHGAEVRAARSEMAVRLRPDGATVMVSQGAAEVAPRWTAAKAQLLRVSQGYEAIAAPAQVRLLPISTEEVDRELAWRQGGVAFDGQSLAEAATEFNRYNRQQVVVADPSIRPLRVGGYFQSSDMPGFVRAVIDAFPVKAEQSADGTVYLSRRSDEKNASSD